jgi:hypothetical protein
MEIKKEIPITISIDRFNFSLCSKLCRFSQNFNNWCSLYEEIRSECANRGDDGAPIRIRCERCIRDFDSKKCKSCGGEFINIRKKRRKLQ